MRGEKGDDPASLGVFRLGEGSLSTLNIPGSMETRDNIKMYFQVLSTHTVTEPGLLPLAVTLKIVLCLRDIAIVTSHIMCTCAACTSSSKDERVSYFSLLQHLCARHSSDLFWVDCIFRPENNVVLKKTG